MLNEMAAGRNQTLAQMSLAWALRGGSVTLPFILQVFLNKSAVPECEYFIFWKGVYDVLNVNLGSFIV